MSEAELIEMGYMGIQARMELWATEFTLIFGYLAVLYFFLRRTSIGFRSFTFVMFALTMAFMWIAFAGTDVGAERYFEARAYSIEQGNLPAYWVDKAPYIHGLLGVASVIGHALHAVAITGAFYITFFYRWGTQAE